jgi:hypothetical protein
MTILVSIYLLLIMTLDIYTLSHQTLAHSLIAIVGRRMKRIVPSLTKSRNQHKYTSF